VSAEFLVACDVGYQYPTRRGIQSLPVLSRLNLGLVEGEFFCLLGPSGCGKTTVLNLMAGFLQPTAGVLTLAGRPIERPGADRTVVFQGDDSLFTWLRTIDNVAFGLRMRGVPKHKRHAVAREYLHLVHLDGQESKYPGELSGGMKQRVQIARVLATRRPADGSRMSSWRSGARPAKPSCSLPMTLPKPCCSQTASAS